jgi:hypothetical protein
MKLLPVTVSVNAAPPAVPELGERDAIEGSGLFTGGGLPVFVEEPPPHPTSTHAMLATKILRKEPANQSPE